MFAMNIDNLCEDTDVYAIDLPGFGRSARPDFRLKSAYLQLHWSHVSLFEKWLFLIEVSLQKWVAHL